MGGDAYGLSKKVECLQLRRDASDYVGRRVSTRRISPKKTGKILGWQNRRRARRELKNVALQFLGAVIAL